MFWTYNSTSPQIDIILCKEELTLYELLDQENILQELKTQNLKLIEFLLKPEILRELVDLITSEPPKDIDEAEQYKYPNLACELLTSDIPALNERLVSEEILNKLYNFLQNEPPLNPLLSSYFSRTLSILISRKSEQNWYSYQYTCLQALEFLKAKEKFLELLLKHMGTSSIMDLTHNLVTLVEGPELKERLRSWLQTQNVIPNIIGLLNPQSDADSQANAASLLCGIVQKLRENMSELNEEPESDPILNLLESSKTIELLMDTVFNSEALCETTIEGGIDVLLAIMHPYLPGDARSRQALNFTVHEKVENTPPQHHPSEPEDLLSDIVKAILPFIKKLGDILRNPVKTDPIKLTSGVISPPFGKARLLVAKLIAVLVSLNNSEINKEIIHCDIPELLLDLFYAYSSNNFLHAEVEKLVAYAVDGMSDYTVTECNDDLFLTHLMKKCRLLQRLLQIWEDNEKSEKDGSYRKAYMGYVIRIATLIHIEDENNPAFHDLLHKEVPNNCLNEWTEFVTNTLKPIIEKHTSCLGGVRPKFGQSSENSFEENLPGKELKSSYKDYDAEDDQNVIFSDDPSIIAYGEDGYTDISQNSEEQAERQADLFNVICSQKWTSVKKGLDSLDDDDDEFRAFSWNDENKSNSILWGDSDDENFDDDASNDSNPWSKLGVSSDPWANSSGGSSSDSNWANFDENFCDTQGGNGGNMEACSTLATDVEAYSLFGQSGGQQPVNILSNFSNVNISPPKMNASAESGDGRGTGDVLNGEWPGSHSDGNGFGGNEDSFECYDQNGKDAEEFDRNDDILNLESICGNTLAEKIANAENNIRNENEILMRGMKEQAFRILNNVDDEEQAASIHEHQVENSPPICNVESCEDTEDSNHESGPEQACCLGVKTKSNDGCDCLTENSDFVTAENSVSDAESSTEFGDAENSLDLEDDIVGDKTELDNDVPGAQPLAADEEGRDQTLNCSNSPKNVPILNDTSEKCNNVDHVDDSISQNQHNHVEPNDTPSPVDDTCNKDFTAIGDSTHTALPNGDLVDREKKAASCDKPSKDTREKNDFNKEQIENMNGALIDELV